MTNVLTQCSNNLHGHSDGRGGGGHDDDDSVLLDVERTGVEVAPPAAGRHNR